MLIKVANSPKLLLLTGVGAFVCSSVLYSLFEQKSTFDSMWWAIVTGVTVGYGDTYPTTAPGRIIAAGFMFFMVFFFVPMITASMSSKLIVNRDAFTHDEQQEIKATVAQILDILDDGEDNDSARESDQ